MKKGHKTTIKIFQKLKHDLQQDANISISYLSRKYNCDRKTIRKYVTLIKEEKTISEPNKDKFKCIEIFDEIIKNKLSNGAYKLHIYNFLKSKYKVDFSYQYFTYYLREKEFEEDQKRKNKPTITYETLPGEEGQIDWKENFRIFNNAGKEFKINLFLFKLSFSRQCKLIMTFDKKQDTVFKCLIKVSEELGGLPRKIICDNMKTVIYEPNNSDRKKYQINPKFYEFSKDCNFKIYPCKAYRPQTKGKVEALAKMVDRLKVYEREFETISDLEKIIKSIEYEYNNSINRSTGLIPTSLWLEREFSLLNMNKINKKIIRKYMTQTVERKVNNAGLVSFMNNLYSVPQEYIGKTVYLQEKDNTLTIFSDYEEIAHHNLLSNNIKFQKTYTYDHLEDLCKSQIEHSNLKEVVGNSLKTMNLLLTIKEKNINGKN